MQVDVRARVLSLPAQAYAFGLITGAQRARGDALARKFAADLDSAGASNVSLHAAMKSKDAVEAFVSEAGVDRLNLARQAGTYCLQAYPRWMERNAAVLHASRAKFKPHSPEVQAALLGDRISEAGDDELRNDFVAMLSELRVLVYEGDSDFTGGVAPTEEWFGQLTNWGGAAAFRNATRKQWASDGVLLGWATELPTYNLTHAVIKGAGHLTALDQPYAALDLMSRWMARESLRTDIPGFKMARNKQDSYAAHACSERLPVPPPPPPAPKHAHFRRTAPSPPPGPGRGEEEEEPTVTTGAENEVKETAPEAIAMQEVGGLLQILGCGISLAIALVLCGHWRERRWGTPPRAAHSLQQSLLGEGGRPRARRGSSPACMSSWQAMWKTRWLRHPPASSQLALPRLLSAPDHAAGCPKLRPASANAPLGPCWHPGHVWGLFPT